MLPWPVTFEPAAALPVPLSPLVYAVHTVDLLLINLSSAVVEQGPGVSTPFRKSNDFIYSQGHTATGSPRTMECGRRGTERRAARWSSRGACRCWGAARIASQPDQRASDT